MNTGWIRYAVIGITMCIVYIVIDRLHSRGGIGEGTDTSYVVKAPGLLKIVYLIMFILGLVLFFFFLLLWSYGNPTISKGHLRFALVFAGIGLLVMIYACSWKVTVDNGTMTIYRLFRSTDTVSVAELDPVEAGSKGQLVLRSGGKKIFTADPAADNFERLTKTLREYGKMK